MSMAKLLNQRLVRRTALIRKTRQYLLKRPLRTALMTVKKDPTVYVVRPAVENGVVEV